MENKEKLCIFNCTCSCFSNKGPHVFIFYWDMQIFWPALFLPEIDFLKDRAQAVSFCSSVSNIISGICQVYKTTF